MTAHGDNPTVHVMVLRGDLPHFVCNAATDAPCRIYPGCECEAWSEEHGDPRRGIAPTPGHEPVQQETCWIEPWINADVVENYDEETGVLYSQFADDEEDSAIQSWRAGPVSTTWEGDYMLWRYADEAIRADEPIDELVIP